MPSPLLRRRGAGQAKTPLFAFRSDIASLASRARLTLATGAPTPLWTVTEADGTVYPKSGATWSHTRTAAGVMTVRLLNTHALRNYVTQIDCNSDGMTALLNGWERIVGWRRFPKLQQVRFQTNASLTITGALADLPTGMTYLNLYSTTSAITGTLADLPAGMTYLYLYGTTSAITGTLADLPAGMTQLYLNGTTSTITGTLADLPAGVAQLQLYGTTSTITGTLADLPAGVAQLNLYGTTSTITGALADLPAGVTYLNLSSTTSTITGGATPMAAVGAGRDFRLYSMTMTQGQVDDVLARIYTDRALFSQSGATPILQIGGTNPDPSGTYADEDPPVTGLGMAYELVNDPEVEGFRKWSITY